MSNIGIPTWVFQLQPRNSEAREPTIKDYPNNPLHIYALLSTYITALMLKVLLLYVMVQPTTCSFRVLIRLFQITIHPSTIYLPI